MQHPTLSLPEYLARHPETRYLDVFYGDLSCVLRGKRYPISQAEKVFNSGMMCPGGSFLLSVTGESLDPLGMGFSDGDPDEIGMPIPHSLSPCPWAQVPTAQVMVGFQSLQGDAYYFEPRNVLQRVLQKFKTLKLTPVVAFEFEFYLFESDTSDGLRAAVSPRNEKKSDANQVYSLQDIEDFSILLDEITQTCRMQNVETGAISSEYSAGQFEINLQHHDDPLLATDQSMMFRRVVQATARKHGYIASFMAKPFSQHSGSGLHLHISLIDEHGNNVFAGNGDFGEIDCTSNILQYSVAGLQNTLAESMALIAPNINAYHRFMPNSYVPISPSWGFENRSVAFRIPKSPAAARRIEHRVAGADANPYLLLASVLAGIHHGISQKQAPRSATTGNAGEKQDKSLPFDLPSAMQHCRTGNILSQYLGQQYLDAYTACKQNEYDKFCQSNIEEYQWYL